MEQEQAVYKARFNTTVLPNTNAFAIVISDKTIKLIQMERILTLFK